MTDALAQTAVFEYIGQARLVVRGEVTRRLCRLYRFESFGAKVMVDLRDAPSCASVPWLVRA